MALSRTAPCGVLPSPSKRGGGFLLTHKLDGQPTPPGRLPGSALGAFTPDASSAEDS